MLRGKTVLVTGVGVGLVANACERAARGANVVMAARTSEPGRGGRELDPGESGSRARDRHTNDAEACAALVHVAKERFGGSTS